MAKEEIQLLTVSELCQRLKLTDGEISPGPLGRQNWSRLYGRQVSEEEYWQITTNLEGFFNTLLGWQKNQERTEKGKNIY